MRGLLLLEKKSFERNNIFIVWSTNIALFVILEVQKVKWRRSEAGLTFPDEKNIFR